MKRSSKYDMINKNTSNNRGSFNSRSTKEKAKFIWKITRIFIYLFLAALALTGCIQSMVLRSSSTVGSGIEFYNGKNNVAPYVNNFKINKSKVKRYKFDENGNYVYDENGKRVEEEDEINVLEPLKKENYLVSNQTISNLKEQLNKTYSENIANFYGEYNNRSSSLRIVGLNDKNLSSTDNKDGNGLNGLENGKDDLIKGTKTDNYLFLNNIMLEKMAEEGIDYTIQNNWYDINFFVAKKPENEKDLTTTQKNIWGRGITNINNSFQAYEKINNVWRPVQIQNGQYVTYDADGDGRNDSETLVNITNPERISKFKYALNADVVSLKKENSHLFNSEKYARDFIQSLANIVIQFDQVNNFINNIISKPNDPKPSDLSIKDKFENYLSFEKLNNLTSDYNKTNSFVRENQQAPENIRNAIDDSKLFSAKQKESIVAYQESMLDVISKSGFGIRPQVYDDESNPNNASWSDPYNVEFLPTINNKKDKLIGAAPVEQKPITSWGDAWGLGPFYGLVVWPIAYTISGLSNAMPSMNGWGAILSIIIAVIFTRIFTLLFTYKSLFSQHKQQMLAPKKAKIDAKYEGYKGNKQMEQRKRQEIADLYKKNNVSLVGPLLGVLITMPIFLAMWRVVQGIPDIKSSTWLGIQFSLTSWRELFNGAWQYLPLLIVAVVVQLASQLLPRYLSKKRMSERANVSEKAALKKANKTQNIMMLVFVFLAVAFEAGVQIYWIVGGLWQISQTLFVNWIVKTDFYKEKLYKYV